MTSASSDAPLWRSISTTAPTGAGKSATAAVMPTVRTTLPSSAVGMMASSCSASSSMERQILGKRT